jgi:hypothetical protein
VTAAVLLLLLLPPVVQALPGEVLLAEERGCMQMPARHQTWLLFTRL